MIVILTLPTITLGKSNISRLMVKQNVQGTTRFVGLIKMQELYTAESVLSKACNAYFSQYSTAEESLINYKLSAYHVVDLNQRLLFFSSYLVNIRFLI